MRIRRSIVLAFAATCAALVIFAQQQFVDVQIIGPVTKPKRLEPTPERVRALQVPGGFRVTKCAEGLGNARMLAAASDGTIYVTRREEGDVLMLRDVDGDGAVDQRNVVAKKPDMHGIALDGDRVYLATVREVYATERKPDGTFGELSQIIGDLPDGGQHPNRTLAVGPDRMLYITVGSTCNACRETNEESATILRARLDGSSREVFTSGLRNTLGFDWHPETGELWSMDHGIDWLGDNEQGEELNLLVRSAKYGWPFVYGKGKFNPADEPPGDTTKEEWARASREPALLYTAHAAPMQMVFYDAGQFPAGYRNDAFIAMRGSWNRRPPSGYEVVRIRFENGKPVGFESFLTGFLVKDGGGWGYTARLAGIAIDKTGALLVSDDSNGIIYRISHEGGGASPETARR